MLSDAGKKGIRALYLKYGSEQFRQWRRDCYKIMKSKLLASNPKAVQKKVSVPKSINESLAELVGVYLGDGTLTDYFIRISGDQKHDVPYFEHLKEIVYSVFGIESTIRNADKISGLALEIRSKAVCDYFKSLGLNVGDKIRNQSKIPSEIYENEKLFYSCLRGLIDTDGFIGKDGTVLSIRFYNKNNALMQQLRDSPYLTDLFGIRNHSSEIGSRSQKSIDEFFRLVGSSNPRHIIRYLEARKGNLLYKQEIIPYYSKYSCLQLPYFAGKD